MGGRALQGEGVRTHLKVGFVDKLIGPHLELRPLGQYLRRGFLTSWGVAAENRAVGLKDALSSNK